LGAELYTKLDPQAPVGAELSYRAVVETAASGSALGDLVKKRPSAAPTP
jgi:hypothetical protein